MLCIGRDTGTTSGLVSCAHEAITLSRSQTCTKTGRNRTQQLTTSSNSHDTVAVSGSTRLSGPTAAGICATVKLTYLG